MTPLGMEDTMTPSVGKGRVGAFWQGGASTLASKSKATHMEASWRCPLHGNRVRCGEGVSGNAFMQGAGV